MSLKTTTTKKTKSPKTSLPRTLTRTIKLPVEGNDLLESVLHKMNSSREIKTLWRIINTNAIQRLGMTDHGPIHFQIVATNSLIFLRLLKKANIEPSIVKDFNLKYEHAEVVVVLASLLHDIGMTVNRKGHEEFSVVLVSQLLKELLEELSIEDSTIIISETLHAIISHRSEGQPLTLEAGIVRVADALDMSKGRSRIPYERGRIDIHSVSAMAVDTIEISQGTEHPIEVDIVMNHTAGIFQVDDLLKKKLTGSGIEQFVEIRIFMDKGDGRQLFKDFYQKKI